jgi:CubicO group peptidase (beta-lactamase class C family)
MEPGSWVFVGMPPGWHITTGPGVLLYPTANGEAAGNFSLEAEIFLFPESTADEYGIFLGGRSIDGTEPPGYLAFVLRGDGQASVLSRRAGQTSTLADWTGHSAILKKHASDAVKNVIRVDVDAATLAMSVNGTRILEIPRKDLVTDGRFGLRAGNGMNLHVSSLNVTRRLAPVPVRTPAPEVHAIDAIVRRAMERQKVPGVAVAVVRKGSVLLAKGYGDANVEHRVPVTPDTIFQSGSVGKQFTAAAVMLMVEQEKLALDDPLTKFFPDAPAHWSGIKVRHLLTHTSGIPDYTGGSIDYRKDHSEEDLVRMAYTLKPEFAPGSRWNYSNTAYVLLGVLVRKASGKFYGDVLREQVFEPLGMRTARVISEADIVPNRAAGYRLEGGQLKNQNWVSPSMNTTADGSLYLSLRDLIAWDTGVRERKVLKPESWQMVLSPVVLNSGKTYPYGFGWSIDNFNGHRVEAHGGSWQGFQTFIGRFPDDELSVVVLTNLAQAEPVEIAEEIVEVFDPTLRPAPLKPIEDQNPAVQARVRTLLEAARAGKLTPEEFAYVRVGFFPNGVKHYAELLSGVGAVKSLTLLQARDLGDDRVYTYDVTFEKRTLRLTLAIAPDGRIATFSLNPPPSGG